MTRTSRAHVQELRAGSMTSRRGPGVGGSRRWSARVASLAVSMLAVTLTGVAVARGASGPPETPVAVSQRPAGTSGTVVVPDRFLRRWDPVTVFFAADRGPSSGGPEDAPERVVGMRPAHPGAWTWLDARTLQLRPAEPWPPLERFTFVADGRETVLATLMEAPTETIPAAGAEDLEGVSALTLTFPEPVAVEALARMVTLELRPLPGVGPEGARFLDHRDFEVKVLERESRSDVARYVLNLNEELPGGMRVTVHFRLSLDDEERRTFAEVSFATAEPFRLSSVGCAGMRLPLTVGGTRYEREQAMLCNPSDRRLTLQFSAQPASLDPVAARNLVRLQPGVDDVKTTLVGRVLVVTGSFAAETLYQVTLTPTPLVDARGRSLQMTGPSELYLSFPRQEAYLQWGADEGIVERGGAQMVPLEGRGDERVDLRVHRVDPLDRSLWPFPRHVVTSADADRPPGPGEEPEPFTEATRYVDEERIVEHIKALPSPQVSTLVDLPLRKSSAAATFGLDLAPYLERAAGKGQPGTYLAGIRRLGPGSERSWMRLQVTDLALATVEEPHTVRFVVTSLATAAPVPGARVRVEGARNGAWVTAVEGTTDAAGIFVWDPPGETGIAIRRIVVTKDADTLVLNPTRAPDGYADGRFSPTRQLWLEWTQGDLAHRGPQPELLAHLFSERPVYRPEETVHLKGYLRRRHLGTLEVYDGPATLIVEGPGDLEWRFPQELNAQGSFYQAFTADNPPTGVYRAHLEVPDWGEVGEMSFRVEAYRIPEFEVQLAAPERVAMDREFKVALTATYYAGGRVAARPVHWRVTQFPYAWAPKAREGFAFSSDARYSSGRRFESSGKLDSEVTTDADGGATLVLNPAVESTAQPRTYVIEATVTGADDQTVTAVRQVVALPPFVLGLKVPRFLPKAEVITPEVLVLGPDDKELSGQVVTVRLLHRRWHSVLQASDFSEGKARYVTEVVDEKERELTVTSGEAAVPVNLPIREAGVYVVELESADRLGRSQTISLDLFAGGEEPMAWPKPTTQVFTISADRKEYNPGEVAHLVLQSPFQEARALLVVEAPEGNQVRWVAVHGGTATVDVPVLPTYVPRLPVHVVLMRGRIPGTAPARGGTTDLGKPATMAATSWLNVKAVENRVEVKLDHPTRALPGQKIPLTITLADTHGKPLPGEVTLWLVDAAVLALGREQRLDPLPDFITDVLSHLAVRDTRNLAFGRIPFAQLPGGDEGEEGGLFDRTTVRKNFKTVPYYKPDLMVGPDGKLTVEVELPDNLTTFKVRAKAVSGAERFGFATSAVDVRLPVIVQPALPRFVRPTDTFTASAVGRVVEGEGGPGQAQIRVAGVELKSSPSQTLTFVPNQPQRLDFDVSTPTPPFTEEGRLATTSVLFSVAVERSSDGARDAFEVSIPLRDDRQRVTTRQLETLEPGKELQVKALPEPARPGSVRRSLLLSDQPGLVRMAAGLDFLLAYPHGCTEQRLSRARAQIALKSFRDLLAEQGNDEELERGVRQALEWIPAAVDSNGLVAYWPGSPGYVSLTAWTVQFMVEAKAAGFRVDEKLLDRLLRSLEQALRSDYGRFIDGESFAERCWALVALAQAGRTNPAYAAELARKAQFLDLEGTAEVLQAFALNNAADSAQGKELARKLWDGVVVRLWQGRDTYGGLQATATARNGLILPSETRSLAELTRALARTDAKEPRFQLLVDGLVTLGRGDGWGTTNANAAALLALSELLKPPFAASQPHRASVRLGGAEKTLAIGPDAPVAAFVSTSPDAGRVLLQEGSTPAVLRLETTFIPQADGSTVTATSAGFVVSREMLVVQGGDVPPEKVGLDTPRTVELTVAQVVEDHVQVVNPSDRFYVAVVVPLAAGIEPLNPNLATAPPEARPSGALTLEPTYVAYLDDQVAFYYNSLPKGTYDFYFRGRAQVPGSFVQPAAFAEMMYDQSTRGNGAGARVVVRRLQQ